MKYIKDKDTEKLDFDFKPRKNRMQGSHVPLDVKDVTELWCMNIEGLVNGCSTISNVSVVVSMYVMFVSLDVTQTVTLEIVIMMMESLVSVVITVH